MPNKNIKKGLVLLAVGFLIGSDSYGIGDTAVKQSRIYFAEQQTQEYLNVYNCEDYIAEDEDNDDGTTTKGLISKFEDYCLETLGRKVTVNYSGYDTNENMLSEYKTGKTKYDLICSSDYIIQKMMADGDLVKFDEGSTPEYDANVSPYVKGKMSAIKVNNEPLTDYSRGYMWGTLGLLYNNGFSSLESKGITASEMNTDMKSWLSLWDSKYMNLIAIKDSMRDTYSVGVIKTFNDDFELNGISYQGFQTLKILHDAGSITDEEYNEKVTTIFNFCDDTSIQMVQNNLKTLKSNAFGFEVDSGKTDMARGKFFAIDMAWSGDAAYAMDQADEFNEAKANDSTYTPTILRYSLPETGANIWFDGWFMPKEVHDKGLAEAFVDFISTPDNVCQNMDYIGYTSVIAGDQVLNLIQSWYDLRWNDKLNDGEGGIDETATSELTLVDSKNIYSLTDEEIENSYYEKSINYFFNGTLNEKTDADTIFAVSASEKDRQFDTMYPDEKVLPSLAVMADFGTQNASITMMWEQVKNTDLPAWAYYTILAVVVLIIALIIIDNVRKHAVKARRRQRKYNREMKIKKSQALMKSLTESLLTKDSPTAQIPVVK